MAEHVSPLHRTHPGDPVRAGLEAPPTGTVRNMWVCYECPTLVERPAGSTGIALCTEHQDRT